MLVSLVLSTPSLTGLGEAAACSGPAGTSSNKNTGMATPREEVHGILQTLLSSTGEKNPQTCSISQYHGVGDGVWGVCTAAWAVNHSSGGAKSSPGSLLLCFSPGWAWILHHQVPGADAVRGGPSSPGEHPLSC